VPASQPGRGLAAITPLLEPSRRTAPPG
jgi:hypothetical protein